MSTTDLDIAIVGAGSAGLAAGRHVQSLRPDLTLRLFEAGTRRGGRAYTVAVGEAGYPIDLGCGWLHGGRDNIWTVIAARTGFTIDRTPAPWDSEDRSYGLTPYDDAAAAQAIGAFFERSEQALPEGTDAPLSSLLEPGCRWNGLIDAIGTYINGVELDRASLLDFQRYEPGRGPDPRVREGYGRLIDSYGSGLPVALDTPVARIDHSGPRLRLDTPRGWVTVRAVIVTVPTSVLAGEGIRFEPPLPDKTAAASALPLGLADKLFVGLPADVDLPSEMHLMGTADTAGTASYHVRPFGRPVIECYFGGKLAWELEAQGLHGSLDFVRRELSPHLGADIANRLVVLRGSAWGREPYINGSYSYAEPGASDQRGLLARPVDERLFFAGEACSRHRFSTAHGAFETGVAAAEAAVAALSKAR